MVDIQEIAIIPPPSGVIRMVGKVHGALNTVVVPSEDESQWFFKQFVSQTELEEYARKYNLTVEMKSASVQD